MPKDEPPLNPPPKRDPWYKDARTLIGIIVILCGFVLGFFTAKVLSGR